MEPAPAPPSPISQIFFQCHDFRQYRTNRATGYVVDHAGSVCSRCCAPPIFQNMEVHSDEKQLLDRLRQGDETALDRLFETYYRYLFKIAHTMLRDTDAAKDCVQEVFLRFWQKRNEIEVKTTLKGYLQRSIVNECLALLRKQRTFSQPETQAALADSAHSPLQHLESDSLAALVQAAIERLPEQCRLIFRLSRSQEMSYREIAEHLDLSPKTVENQIGKALKQLRADLGPWLSILLPTLAANAIFF